MKKILFVTSEAYPLIKTGGLADVSGSLPKALAEQGEEVRILLPNYQAIKTDEAIFFKSTLSIAEAGGMVAANILETRLPGTAVTVWLVDFADYFGLPGNPYVDASGVAWPNNAARFALFCRVAVELAMDRGYLGWQPDIVHCNDWQSGLVPALLSLEQPHPATVFTIHNMAYQGLFEKTVFTTLGLPKSLWGMHGVEFNGLLSFLKGGLAYADHITTVSPSYAEEIQTPAFGYGLEGLLSHRKAVLTGIINGIDAEQWDPETDPYIAQFFNAKSLGKKAANKAALQAKFALPINKKVPLFALISRLVEQKGIDLILEGLEEMLAQPLQFVLLGSGDKGFEQQLLAFAQRYPDKMAVFLGYDEGLSHLIEAGADVFLMPSRFEPCGLNQIYSQRYGTVPIVRKTGGLADTVTDALPDTLADHTATGFVFDDATPGTLLETVKRALLIYSQPKLWRQVQVNGMKKDYSWSESAKQYQKVYDAL